MFGTFFGGVVLQTSDDFNSVAGYTVLYSCMAAVSVVIAIVRPFGKETLSA